MALVVEEKGYEKEEEREREGQGERKRGRGREGWSEGVRGEEDKDRAKEKGREPARE